MARKLNNSRALRILTAAHDEFAKRGFDGARVEEIARRAGVNKQLVFYYYRSKRGLFQAVLARGARDLEQALTAVGASPGQPLVQLRAALAAQFRFLARNADLVKVLTRAGRSEARPFAPAINQLVVLLAEGQGLGEVRGDLDPHLTASQALVLMVAYLLLEPLIAASAPPLGGDESTLVDRWEDSAIRLVLNGVAAP